jgi:hypothetical protein
MISVRVRDEHDVDPADRFGLDRSDPSQEPDAIS